MRVSCPPTAHPCFYGVDFPTREELVAGSRTLEEIREYIGADTLGYLSNEGLLAPFKENSSFCTACFTGEYPVDISECGEKLGLEENLLELNLEDTSNITKTVH